MPRYPVHRSVRLVVAISADHPSLPGHFPGRPVVPGAIILAEVMHAATGLLDAAQRIAGFPSVKFIAPMLPAQACELALTDDGAGAMRFDLTQGAERVASGTLRYELRTSDA